MKAQFFTLGFYFIFISLGCSGCGGVKKNVVKDKTSTSNSRTILVDSNSSANVQKSKLVFPPDFPNISPLPTYLPKSEILVNYSTDGNTTYLFGDKGEFKGEFKEPPLFGQALMDSFRFDKVYYLINKKDNAFFKEMSKTGFLVDEKDINKSKYFSYYGKNVDYLYDRKTEKITGLFIKNNIQLWDEKKSCLLKEVSITKFYDYLGNCTLSLSQNECHGLIYYQNTNNIFSTIHECSCSGEGEEEDCKLKCHRIYNIPSRKTIDINPFKFLDQNNLEWPYNPENVGIGDDIIHFTYYNLYKQLRVIIDLKVQKI
jgi:hypothetical protein